MKREGGMRRWALAWLCLMAAGAWGQAVDATHWQSGGWRAQDGDDMAGADSLAIGRCGRFSVCAGDCGGDVLPFHESEPRADAGGGGGAPMVLLIDASQEASARRSG